MTFSGMRRLVGVLAGALVLSASSFADMIINGGRVEDRHYRFGGSFYASGYDWTGVTVSHSYDGVYGNRITMVSPSYFLTAAHNAVPAGTTVQFKDALGVTYNYAIDSYAAPLTTTFLYGGNWYIRNSDLLLGRLTAPLNPAHGIGYYPVIADGAVYVDDPVFMCDRSQYVGSNNAEFLDIITTVDPPSNPSAVVGVTLNMYYDNRPDEAFLQNGDSSSPTFAVRNGQLALVGIHWSVYPDLVPETYGTHYSIDSYVPYYIDQINGLMVGEQLTVLQVPEPGTLALAGIAMIALLRRR